MMMHMMHMMHMMLDASVMSNEIKNILTNIQDMNIFAEDNGFKDKAKDDVNIEEVKGL